MLLNLILAAGFAIAGIIVWRCFKGAAPVAKDDPDARYFREKYNDDENEDTHG